MRKRRVSKGRLILLIGGAASGKSQRALDLAGRTKHRVFVATAQALDDEMALRIQRHRQGRGASWTTAEVPIDLIQWFEKDVHNHRAIVLDCLTLWLSNLKGRGSSDGEVTRLTAELIRVIGGVNARVVVVTNEVGMGLVPMEPATRQFRDLAGLVNQQFAEAADEVHLVVSGLMVRLK